MHETPFLLVYFSVMRPTERLILDTDPVHQDEHVDGKTTDWQAVELAGQSWTLSDPVQE